MNNYNEEIAALVAKIETTVRAKIIDEIRLGQAAASNEEYRRTRAPEVAARQPRVARANGPAKRHRKSTVASEEQIAAVWQAIADANGVALTVKQINQLCKVGQTTASKAVWTLVERGQVQKIGKGYRLMSEQKAEEQQENGTDQTAADEAISVTSA